MGFKQLRQIEWVKTNPVPLNRERNFLTGGREMAVLGVKGGTPTFNAEYHTGHFKYPIPRSRKHQAQKSLKLITDLVVIHSKKGDLVAFVGSGTTAAVCQALDRKFVGFDIDPEFIERAKELCGIKE